MTTHTTARAPMPVLHLQRVDAALPLCHRRLKEPYLVPRESWVVLYRDGQPVSRRQMREAERFRVCLTCQVELEHEECEHVTSEAEFKAHAHRWARVR